jgi:hypothetical protein
VSRRTSEPGGDHEVVAEDLSAHIETTQSPALVAIDGAVCVTVAVVSAPFPNRSTGETVSTPAYARTASVDLVATLNGTETVEPASPAADTFHQTVDVRPLTALLSRSVHPDPEGLPTVVAPEL